MMTGSPEVSRYEDSVNRDSLAHKSKHLDQIEQCPKMLNSIDPENPNYQYRAYQRYIAQ